MREIRQRADAIFGHIDLYHRAVKAGVRGFVAADQKENRFEGRIVLDFGAILLRAIREIGRRFLQGTVATHLAARRERRIPLPREHVRLELVEFGLRAQTGAYQVLAEHQPVTRFLVAPRILKPCESEHTAQ